MSPLENEQKELIFNFCMGLTSKEESAEAEALISSNEEASNIHSKIKSTLLPLNSLKSESCPDELAQLTIWRLKNAANESQHRLDELLANEQSRIIPYKRLHWSELGKRLAIAALFMIVGSVLFTSFKAVTSYARHKSQNQQCQQKQASIFEGLSNYISDHDGKQPFVATANGAPWWKVGDQGSQNQSNTRHIYLLVREGYVDISDFMCPGCKGSTNLQMTPEQTQTLKDFPDRNFITFSLTINSGALANERLQCRKVILADRNPLFETLPQNYNTPLKIRLNKKLLTANSYNHNSRGQNVLFGDGRVEFLKTRHIGISEDDIFTLQDTDIYQGYEVPSRATDFFLAP
jgi:hypothetical protein